MFKGSSSAKEHSEESLKGMAGRFGACCHLALPLGFFPWLPSLGSREPSLRGAGAAGTYI